MFTSPQYAVMVKWIVLFLVCTPTLSSCYTISPWRFLTQLHIKNKDQTAISIGVGRQTEKFAEEFVSAVVTGVNLGSTLLSVVNWPISHGKDVLSKGLDIIAALISWFNFLASFVTPGGSGAAVLTWLRGGPAAT